VACACAADILAIHTGMDRNIAYTNGLLHAIGMVVINEWAARNAPNLTFRMDDLPKEASEQERSFFGFTQAEVGAALLRLWDFPREMSEPVRWQYSPRYGSTQTKPAILLSVAKWLRTAVCTSRAPNLPGDDMLKPLALTPEILKGMIRSVGERMDEIASLLEV